MDNQPIPASVVQGFISRARCAVRDGEETKEQAMKKLLSLGMTEVEAKRAMDLNMGLDDLLDMFASLKPTQKPHD